MLQPVRSAKALLQPIYTLGRGRGFKRIFEVLAAKISRFGSFMSEYASWLAKARFARLKLLLPNEVHGISRIDDRRVVPDITQSSTAA